MCFFDSGSGTPSARGKEDERRATGQGREECTALQALFPARSARSTRTLTPPLL